MSDLPDTCAGISRSIDEHASERNYRAPAFYDVREDTCAAIAVQNILVRLSMVNRDLCGGIDFSIFVAADGRSACTYLHGDKTPFGICRRSEDHRSEQEGCVAQKTTSTIVSTINKRECEGSDRTHHACL